MPHVHLIRAVSPRGPPPHKDVLRVSPSLRRARPHAQKLHIAVACLSLAAGELFQVCRPADSNPGLSGAGHPPCPLGRLRLVPSSWPGSRLSFPLCVCVCAPARRPVACGPPGFTCSSLIQWPAKFHLLQPDPLAQQVSLGPAWPTGAPSFTCSSLIHISTKFHLFQPAPFAHQVSLAPAWPIGPPDFACSGLIDRFTKFHLPRPDPFFHRISLVPA